VLYDNTDNNHVHVTIGKTSYDFKNHKRLHIDKTKLVKIKNIYQENLQLAGIKNVKYKEKITRINMDQEIIKSAASQKKATERSQRLELHNTHKVINFGFNYFKNDPTKKISPFVELESLSKKNRILWDHKLFNQLKEKNIRISNTENKKISLLNDQTTVSISREKKINRGFKI